MYILWQFGYPSAGTDIPIDKDLDDRLGIWNVLVQSDVSWYGHFVKLLCPCL